MKHFTLARKALSLSIGITLFAGLSAAISATSASANCQILGITATPELNGVLCASGDAGGGASAPGGPTSTGCRYDMEPLDDDFMDFIQDPFDEKVHNLDDGSTYTTRTYEKDGQITGTVEVKITPNKTYGIWVYSKKMKQAVAFDCAYSADGPTFQDIDDDVQSDTGTSTTPAAPLPSSTATPVDNPVEVSDWISHVAGTANDYVVKLGFTNTGALPTDVDAAFDLTSLTSVTAVSGPSGYSCDTKAGVELCDVPQLAPGATTTLFVRVSAPTAVGDTIPVTILNEGRLMWKKSAASPRAWAYGPVEKTFLVTRP